jgi:DNA-binding CsgD family transcriptional regulator
LRTNSTARNQKRAHVTVRQLCASGVPGPLLLPALLPAIRGVVPADSAAFFYVSADSEMDAVIAEKLLSVEDMARYYELYYHDEAVAFRNGFEKRRAAPSPVSSKSLSSAERNTNYYKHILSKLGADHILYAVVAFGGTAIGQLSLYRSSESGFTKQDEAALASLLPLISKALATQKKPIAAETPAPQSLSNTSYAVISAEGDVLARSPRFDAEIRLAAVGKISPKFARAEEHKIQLFLRSVLDAWRKLGSNSAQYHSKTLQTELWLERLTSVSGLSEQWIVRLEHNSAPQVSNIKGAQRWGLSPQQSNIALHLANGLSNSQIAHRESISANTAAYHVKAIFSKLGINRRGEIREKLDISGTVD